MNSWFKDWFDSDFYLKVYSHRNDADARKLLEFILANISLPKRAKVLDSSCGNGRHSILLAQKGFDVTGFDLSLNLLKQANVAKEKFNLPIKLIRADIRTFHVKEKFDLIVNLFTSFGYFVSDEENFAFFYNAFGMMESGSYFIFDYLNPKFLQKNLVGSDSQKIGESTIMQSRRIRDNRIEKEIIVNKLNETYKFQESVKLYPKDFLTEKLMKIGFSIINTSGDYDGNNFNEMNSPRIILIMKK